MFRSWLARAGLMLAGLMLSAAVPAPVPPQPRLEAAAQSSARPLFCSTAPGFWGRQGRADVSCSQLARGYTLLNSEPKVASSLASAVLDREPKQPDALLLEARAQVALRNFTLAGQRFQEAGIRLEAACLEGHGGSGSATRAKPAGVKGTTVRCKGLNPLSDSAALHDFARTLAVTAPASESAQAYRLLMPRLEALGARGGRRLSAVVEAALAMMRASERGAGEAVTLLSAHLASSQSRGGELFARAALRLALDRKGGQGLPELPLAALEELTASRDASWVPWLLPEDRAALEATVLEATNPGAAAEAWRRYLALLPGDAPFRSHVESKLRGTAP